MDLLHNDVGALVGQDVFVDTEAPADVGVGELEGGDAVFETVQNGRAIALFFGEEAVAVGDDEAEVAGAGLVDARIVDFVQDAVAEGEPDAADRGKRGADAGLGAGGPAWRNAWPTWCISHDGPSL